MRVHLSGLALLVAACSAKPNGGGTAPSDHLDTSALRDPASCRPCHAQHYGEWAASAHARAGDDPVFVAMNARAQRETGGAIGNFCTRCHAPVAVAIGATTSGLDLASLPAPLRGVTCFFCHSVDAVNGTNDDPLHLATDSVLRGGISNPVATPAHASAYSALHDRDVASSAALCGACHDVALSNGLAIEQTFAEWGRSAYSAGASLASCGKCHMAGTAGFAADSPAHVPMRIVHDHSLAAVDVTGSVDAGAQAALAQGLLDTALSASLCVLSGGGARVTLTNALVGHDFPSGAVHDRRAWVEVVATTSGTSIFESGVLPNDATSVESLMDPNLWLFKEALFDTAQDPVLFMWEAASADDVAIPAATATDAGASPGVAVKTYPVPAGADTVRVRVRMVPFAPEVLNALVAGGDLDAASVVPLPVYTLAGTEKEWTTANGYGCVP